MNGIFEKLRTITLSNIHGLLDAAIDLNSVGAVKQNIRDLESAMQQFETATNEQNAQVRGLTREIRDLDATAKDLDATIDAILTDDNPLNDHVATEKQVELTGITANLNDKQEELSTAKTELSGMEQGLSLMRTRHAEMTNQLSRLESMDRQAKAKESSADALKKAQAAFSTSVDSSVDNLGARIQKRKDVADVGFEQALGSLQAAGNNVGAVALANKAIEERKAKIAAAKAGSTSAPAQSQAAS